MKNLIIGVVVAIIVIALYFVFKSDNSDSSSTLGVVSVENPADTILGRGLLNSLAELQATKLDVNFFDDQIFSSLAGFGHEIAKQDVGRRNPFAPIGSVTAPVATTTSTTRVLR